MSCGGTTGSIQPAYIRSLPPRFLNGEIALDRRHVRQRRLRIGEIAIVVERAQVPVRIVEQEVAEQADARRLLRLRRRTAASSECRVAETLAATRPAGEDLLAGPRVLHAGVHLSERLDLRRRQTRRLDRHPAVQASVAGSNAARARVLDESVFEPVARVTGGDHRLRHQASLAAVRIGLPSASCVADPRAHEPEGLPDAVVAPGRRR